MPVDSRPVGQLRNIGPTVARRLMEIGVRTRHDLKEVGPATAYVHMSANSPGKHLPVCYYLYSLEGALKDLHWNDVPEETKRRLVSQAELSMAIPPT
ncbi:TfoX/Sxy family protein [Parvibaculaceae bacterium PLY_AMNH_Bact1]|nr:TfoX/Sxy family protein [Parvibaculaceae bacterium PLY_AMNH_Bact1]